MLKLRFGDPEPLQERKGLHGLHNRGDHKDIQRRGRLAFRLALGLFRPYTARRCAVTTGSRIRGTVRFEEHGIYREASRETKGEEIQGTTSWPGFGSSDYGTECRNNVGACYRDGRTRRYEES